MQWPHILRYENAFGGTNHARRVGCLRRRAKTRLARHETDAYQHGPAVGALSASTKTATANPRRSASYVARLPAFVGEGATRFL